MPFKILSALLPLFCLTLFCSCSAEQATVKQHYVWPPPPSQARIEWIANYSSQLDLEKSAFRRFKETIVGEDRPINLKRPIEARMDPATEKLYVADMDAQNVYIFDLKENEFKNLDFSSMPGSKGRVKPVSLSLDKRGNVYVLDAFSKSVIIFDQQGKFIKALPLGEFCEVPVSLLYDNANERLLVADAKNNRITAFNPNGTKIFSFGQAGDEPGEFNRPTGMALNSKGEIIVSDTFNARIQIFDGNGRFLRTFGQRGDGVSDFQLIKGVAVDPDDNIYVTDSRSNNIKIYNQSGVSLMTFGGYYAAATTGKVAAGGFALPVGIDIDSRGIISVVDQLNARIQLFRYLPEQPDHAK